MSRKDYILIADAIAFCNRPGYQGLETVAETIACALADDNCNFDKVRFITACGFGESNNDD